MSRALTNPEIIRTILTLCEHRSTLARSARVCRLWKEPALDILWCYVPGLHRLLAILSPLKRVPKCDRDHVRYGFSDRNSSMVEELSVLPSGQDWDRFMTYSRRTKKLSFDGSNSVPFNDELIFHVSLANNKTILPNLESLVWITSPTPSYLFFSITLMSQSLRYLQIVIPNPDFSTSCIPSFLDLVRVYAPSLIEFELFIFWQYTPEHYVDALVKLFQCLPRLQAVKLSPVAFTPEVVETLTKLPHLERLVYHSDYRERQFSHPTLAPSPLGVRVGSFPQLRVLAVPLSSIADFLLMPGRLEGIHNLEIQTISHTDNLKMNFSALPIVFPNLTILKLRFNELGHGSRNAIDMVMLQPLFVIQQIKEFYLSDKITCNISNIDLEKISRVWPMLEVLHLNEDVNAASTKISLSALIPLAKNCRRLYRLGLCIQAQVPILNGTPTPFARLEMLHVGQSSVTRPAKTAAFLSQLCHGPLHIQSASGLIWNLTTNHFDEEHSRIYRHNHAGEKWELVEAIHNALRLAPAKVLEGLGEAGVHRAARELHA